MESMVLLDHVSLLLIIPKKMRPEIGVGQVECDEVENLFEGRRGRGMAID